MRAVEYGKWTPTGIIPEGKVVLLSIKERYILDKMIEGKSNKQIADMASISEQTAKNYTSRLEVYFGVENRTQIAYLVQQGIVKIARSPYERMSHGERKDIHKLLKIIGDDE
jgi:DNA-binding CsgD family transcriptional regulator